MRASVSDVARYDVFKIGEPLLAGAGVVATVVRRRRPAAHVADDGQEW